LTGEVRSGGKARRAKSTGIQVIASSNTFSREALLRAFLDESIRPSGQKIKKLYKVRRVNIGRI